MIGQALLRTTLALGVLALVTSCAELPPTTTSVAPPPAPQGYWNGDGVSGPAKIIVSIADQRAYFYKGKQLVGESTVSTGKPGFGTPPGTYTVFWKDANHVSSVFGDYVDGSGNVVKSNIDSRKDSKPPGSHYDGARMPFAMFFRGGYAMHQGYVPPYAASHGCIRLPQGMAEIFFNASAPGTPVIVKQEAVMPNFTAPPDATMIAPPPRTVVSSTAPAPVSPAVVRTTVPAPSPIPLRSTAPNMVRSTAVRSTVPAPTPMAVRSPAPVVSRKPAPLQSPAPLQTSSPFPLRPSTPAPVRTTSARSTVPTPTPIPLRSPAPNLYRKPGPLQSSAAVPLRSSSPAPLRSPGTTQVSPTPAPARTQTKTKKKHTRSRSRHSPAPSPTPAQ